MSDNSNAIAPLDASNKYNKNTVITIATTINKRRKKGSIGWFIIKGNLTSKSM